MASSRRLSHFIVVNLHIRLSRDPLCLPRELISLKLTSTMSGSSIGARGKRNGSVFMLSCVLRVFFDRALHGRLPAEQPCMCTHMKFSIDDDIKFTLLTLSNKEALSSHEFCGTKHR